MAEKSLEALVDESVVRELGPLILRAIQTAFPKISDASDILELGSGYANPVDGYMAYFTIQNEMEKIDGLLPGLTVERKPNRNASSFHAEVRYKGIVATIASANVEDGLPRWAGFRQDLVQGIFDSETWAALAEHPDHTYVQFVYGRSGTALKFLKAVCTRPQPIVIFLYPEDGAPAADAPGDGSVEIVKETDFGFLDDEEG